MTRSHLNKTGCFYSFQFFSRLLSVLRRSHLYNSKTTGKASFSLIEWKMSGYPFPQGLQCRQACSSHHQQILRRQCSNTPNWTPMSRNPTTRIRNSSTPLCHKNPDGDISGTKRGIIVPLLLKQPIFSCHLTAQ